MSFNISDVYMGFWADRSKENPFLSSKLTLSSDIAKFLTAFFAMYVTFAASKLWDITAYAIHFFRQGRITERCRPVLRQQQVVLKNSLSPGSTAHRLLQIWWANRSHPSTSRDSWPLVLFAVLCGIGCLTAGLYSNKIVDMSPGVEVLLNSPSCGFIDRSNVSIPNNLSMAVMQYYLDSLAAATAYSRKCYNTTSTQDCGPFTEPMIDWATSWDVECPFNDSMCLGPAMQLDTGEINSNKVLGLNSEPKDQINLRKVTTCAPIIQDGFTAIVVSNASTATTVKPIADDQMTMNVYGPSRRKLGGNYTWGVSEDAASSTLTRTMWMEYYYNGLFANLSTFSPIPELNRSTGDGTLCFISSNAILFVEPCDDPVFAAHVPHYDGTDDLTYYLGDRVTGVLGCLEQYQWCNPSNKVCTLIGSLADTKDEVAQVLNPTAMQSATVHMLVLVLSSLANIPFLGSEVTENLMANQKVNGQIQFPLPSNQWQVEVQGWHGTIMKLLQEGILRWVIGPSDTVLQEHLLPPASPEQAALCHLHRIRPGPGAGVANVSTFGLFFVLTVGTIVILVSLFIDCVAALLGRFSKTVRTKQRAWIEDDALQLQRMAYEADARVQEEAAGRSAGLVWTGRDEDVPAVEGDDALLEPLPGSEDEPEAIELATIEEHSAVEEPAIFNERSKAPERRWSM
ncbi:hypothetical protein F4820DRAFT_467279 [Hypoxylon rubiginosum]|uniref:Uncharacterized protein n=1 Tax=Hypoxylon rubiginosum TaxID=110542 RepID=A0ACB9YID5_9PEZI|nr:hypothetical protein F4820DRAFT_467279 [Hypoxylon rubiginosum]